MNEPPPVLHSGTMYSWPSGFVSASLPSGLLIDQLTSPVPRSPFVVAVDDVHREDDRQEYRHPRVRRSTEIASAVAVNCGRPITRPNVVVERLRADRLDALGAGRDRRRRRRAQPRRMVVVVAPAGVNRLPVTVGVVAVVVD